MVCHLLPYIWILHLQSLRHSVAFSLIHWLFFFCLSLFSFTVIIKIKKNLPASQASLKASSKYLNISNMNLMSRALCELLVWVCWSDTQQQRNVRAGAQYVFNNTDSWTQTCAHICLCGLKAWTNEVTFKWVRINKSAGPFNTLCPVSAQRLFYLSAGDLTEGVLALLQINIGLNIWPCHHPVVWLWLQG